MRFGIMSLLCLVLCTLGTFSFGELEDTSETASPQLSLVSDTLWAEQLTTFQKTPQDRCKSGTRRTSAGCQHLVWRTSPRRRMGAALLPH